MAKTCADTWITHNQRVLSKSSDESYSGDLFYSIVSRRKLIYPTGSVIAPGKNIVTLRLLSLSLILALHCRTLQLIHDAPRKQASPHSWFGLLAICRTIVNHGFLLWCVLLTRCIRLIHKLDNRTVRCTFLYLSRYLCVRFLLPQSPLFLNKT